MDSASGQILACKLAAPEDYRKEFVECILDCSEQLGVIPKEILTEKDETVTMLAPMADILNIKLSKVKRLKEFGNVKKHFEEHRM